MASLDANSGDILVSLTRPVGGAAVTAYRIYYSIGGSQSSELFAPTEGQLVLDLKGDTPDEMMISIRAESAQLPSELVTVNVTAQVVESTTAMEVPSTTTTGPPTELPSTTTTGPPAEYTTTMGPPIELPSTTTTEPATESEQLLIIIANSTMALLCHLQSTSCPIYNVLACKMFNSEINIL